MTRLPLVVLALIANTAWAQPADPLPAQFSVIGVAANDTLNIRAEPVASAAPVGGYGPYTINIEVLRLSPDGGWGLVGNPEANGWVSMRYLERQDTAQFEIPRPLSCSGTEPFWGLILGRGGTEFSDIELGPVPQTLTGEAMARDGFLATTIEGPTLGRTLIVTRGQCGDGMSDREFGWRASLFTQAPDGNSLMSGCCTMDGNR